MKSSHDSTTPQQAYFAAVQAVHHGIDILYTAMELHGYTAAYTQWAPATIATLREACTHLEAIRAAIQRDWLAVEAQKYGQHHNGVS